MLLSCVKPPEFIEEHIEYQEANIESQNVKVMQRFSSLLEKNPNDANAMYLFGRLQEGPEAEKWYNNALKEDPRNRYAMNGLAKIWLKQNKLDLALEWGLKSVKGDSTFWRGYLTNAEILDSLKQYQESLTQLRKLLTFLPITSTQLTEIVEYREEVRKRNKANQEEVQARIEKERIRRKRKSDIENKMYNPVGTWIGESEQNGKLFFNFRNYGKYSLKIDDGAMRVNGTWKRKTRNTFSFTNGSGKMIGNKFHIRYGNEEIVLTKGD